MERNLIRTLPVDLGPRTATGLGAAPTAPGPNPVTPTMDGPVGRPQGTGSRAPRELTAKQVTRPGEVRE